MIVLDLLLKSVVLAMDNSTFNICVMICLFCWSLVQGLHHHVINQHLLHLFLLRCCLIPSPFV